MSSHGGVGPIPNRWIGCPRKSETIIAERFIAFKTPLSSAFNKQMDLKHVFMPEMIFGWCKTLKLKLGLWIDLTNTKRFYDRSVVETQGAQYVKLQCRGHGETPSAQQTRSFIEIVDEFVSQHPMELVAVHCTHGFNRTGFLIASYLIERSDFAVDTALALFATARPPGIYKQDYVNELYSRYEPDEDPLQAPPTPDWGEDDFSHNAPRKRTHDEPHEYESAGASNHQNDLDEDDQVDDNDTGAADAGENGSETGEKPRKKRRRETVIKNATFMSGVPGVHLVTDQPRLGELQLKVQEMCGWEKSGFPGAQPVSMDRTNIRRLHEIPYRVSWKADGTRYMMLIDGLDNIYFFDRNHSCFQVENMTFLKAGNLQEHLSGTLVDGEMVLDKFQGKTIPRYLIYDIIKISNRDMASEPSFVNRLRCIRKEIIEPRVEAITKGIVNRNLEPFSVRCKDFWELRAAASLLGEKFAKSLSHEPDGLIFQPSLQPYTPGVCPDVLKWKPSELNSVDFRLKILTESGQGILPRKVGILCVGGNDQQFAQIKLTRNLRDLENKIVECTVNMGQWEFLRERTDKSMPNSYNTAVSVCESIRNPVTKEYLLDFIDHYGFRDDNDIMPPPSQARRPQQPSHTQPHPQQQQQAKSSTTRY